MSEFFEYKTVRLETRSFYDMEALVAHLNELGSQKWRVVPGVVLSGCWVLMERGRKFSGRGAQDE